MTLENTMSDAQVSKDKLVSDFKAVVADTEELLKLTAGQAGDKVADVRSRLSDKLVNAKYKLQDIEAAVVEKTKAAARVTDDYVHENPWKAVGVAAGVGFLLGLLVNRR
jgi:ElaB/YqjD/DUF883 family membrane-anchored ribosome-binding protein